MKARQIKLFLSIALLSLIATSYNACSDDVKFDEIVSSKSTGDTDLVPVPIDEGEDNDNNDVEPPIDGDGDDNDVEPPIDGDGDDNDVEPPIDGDGDDNDVDPPVVERNAMGSICILEGPGKSQKLALFDGAKIVSKEGATYTVCMSEYACNEIVSQSFPVKGPHPRGFCGKGGAHSIQMTDEEVASYIE